MTTGTDRAEMKIHLGDQTRLLKFGSNQVDLFEGLLEMDPLMFVAKGGGQTKFVIRAVIAGLSYDKALKQSGDLTPLQVGAWLDLAPDFNREDFMRDVLYCIARGKSREEQKRWLKVLDEVFGGADGGAANSSTVAEDDKPSGDRTPTSGG